MVFGGLATIVALLALAWVRELVGGFLGLFGASRESEGVKITIVVFAVGFVYILDFSINTGTKIFRRCTTCTNILQFKLESELLFWIAVQVISKVGFVPRF